jgi:hypothetical protein
MDKFREKLEELKKAELRKLTPENLRDCVDEESGVYVIYKDSDSKQRPLYVGGTKSLNLRLSQLLGTIHFDHTFTWGLFLREMERMSQYDENRYLQFWDGDKKSREEIVRKIERLLDKLWFKHVELGEHAEYRELEAETQYELKPLNPHLKKSEIPLDDLLR